MTRLDSVWHLLWCDCQHSDRVLPNNNNNKKLRVTVSSISPVHPWPRAVPLPSTALALWSTMCTGSDLPQVALHSASYGRKRTLRHLHSDWGCWSGGTACVWKGKRRHTLWRWSWSRKWNVIKMHIWPALSASVDSLGIVALRRIDCEYVSGNIFKLWNETGKMDSSE